MPTLHVLRVFTDKSGGWGNPLGVFLDGATVRGSLVYARPGPDGSCEAGGRVVLDETRDYTLS